jgi:AAA+ superfamily predicted ATPase
LVSTIRVLIAQDNVDLPLRGVAEKLSRLPDFHLVEGRIVPPAQVELVVATRPVDVVILVGDDPVLEELGRRLIERDQGSTVVRLTIVPPSLSITPSVSEFGIAHLADMLRAIVRSSPLITRARLLHKKLTAAGVASDDSRAADSDCLTAACLWLNTLLKNRTAQEHDPQNGDLPGLTIGRDTVVRLLDQHSTQPPDDAAGALWAAVEAALVAERDITPLAILLDRLALTELERKALLLCLSPELDIRYQRALGYLHDDYSRRHATLGLICSLLGEPLAARAGLAASSGLYRWHLIEAGPQGGWTADEPLRLDRSVLGWVLDHRSLLHADPQLRRAVRAAAWPGALHIAADDADRERLLRHLATARPGDRILLTGGEPDAWRARIEAATIASGAEPVRVEVGELASLTRAELEDFAVRAARTIRLFAPIPIFDATGAAPDLLSRLAESVIPECAAASVHPILVIVDGPERSRQLFAAAAAILERSATTSSERSGVLASVEGVAMSVDDATRIARTFSLPESDTALAVGFAQALAAGTGSENPVGAAEVAAACRRIASPNLPSFAHRIEPTCSLRDVVLPENHHRQLREVIAHVNHAATVLDEWRFADQMPYGRGVAALFSGPSGTGKTMAAYACARELNNEICVVDLAQLPSKYIGETNKNLDVLFREAERSGAVLLFDEAEALFGKRSEVKDAHDRYANIEVAYLLQRIEAFAGLAILTTNFRQNLDLAFLRRFRFTVEFPTPDAAAREKIWRKCVPESAPLADDVDLRFIARRLELTGGNIRQITLRAAFSAAAAGTAITMRHFVEATRAELVKIGMHQAERELAERVA